MKLVLVLLGICAVAMAASQTNPSYKVADRAFLEKQKDVFLLFHYYNQPNYYKEFVEIAATFKWEGMWEQWTEPAYAKEFWSMYQNGTLPRGEVFSIFHPEHLKQAIALFKTLYFAKNYEIFHKIAVWSRQNINEGMFIYAYSVAILHGQFTVGIVLPAIHEIVPFYFINNKAISKAQQYKQSTSTCEQEDEMKGYTFQANYTNWYLDINPEQSTTYFTEDIGVGSCYYYFHIIMPWWISDMIDNVEENNRGEYFDWFHQQFLARYNLERVSNHMYPIEGGFYSDFLIVSRFLFGNSYLTQDDYTFATSDPENFKTSLRYQKQYTGPYKAQDLVFDGVKIVNATVNQMTTYFDEFYSDMSNVLYMDEKETRFNDNSFLVRARQYRLNHKPFNYKIDVISDKSVEAFVKVFIGPKYDENEREIDLDRNRHNFFELDRFQYTLDAGKNMIKRNSMDSIYFSRDPTTYLEMYKQVMTALNGGEPFKYYDANMYYTFPQRMLLPKSGTFQLFVMVAPFHKPQSETNTLVNTNVSLGYPLDRVIDGDVFLQVPNLIFLDVSIHHKNM